jgi:esterase/lipase
MNKIVVSKNYRVLEQFVDSDKVLFIFTAMGTKIGLYRLFMKLMNQQGYNCVVYDYPLRTVLTTHHSEWEGMYDELVHNVQQKIEKYKKCGKQKFYIYGVSMGTLFANKIARETADITHVVLNLTYGDLASNIWTYRGVKKVKKNLIKAGHNLDSAKSVVSFADPITNAHKLRGKKVLMYLSRTDQVLVYDHTRHTLQSFKDVGLDLHYVENKYLGHYLGGAKNMLGIKRLVKFLES